MYIKIIFIFQDNRGFLAPATQRSFSEAEYHTVGPNNEVEYFFASDARYGSLVCVTKSSS